MECSNFLHLWRRWIRFVVVVVYIVLLVIAVPLCIWELERNGAPDHVQAWFIGGMFVLMALPISFWGILQHIINYTTPHLQRYIIRILWMVPIYALNAWFALRFPSAAIYLDTLRECYEAYVIYNFMAYLLSFLNHEYPHLDIQIENKSPVHHIFPFCLLPPCHFSQKFIQRCKHGVLQYTVVRPTMTIIALICEMFGKYNEGDFNFTSAWSYTVIISNMSQILAMYCLVLFYKAFREELQPLKPVPKFLCVKAVVFLSFWQSLFIAILVKTGVITEHGSWVYYKDVKALATGLQDFIICIEMFVAAIAHYFSFSHTPFVNLAAEQQNCCASFLSMWNVQDFTEDVVEHARYIGRGMHNTLSKGKRLVRGRSSERTPLLADAGDQESSRHLSAQPSSQKSQNGPGVKSVALDDDTVSSGGDSMYGRRYDTFVNKSTTSSMMNYADFRSEASQTEIRPNLSRSVSLRGYDESSGDDIDEDNCQVKRDEVAEVKVVVKVKEDGTVSKHVRGGETVHHVDVHDDDTFHHLDVHEDDTAHHGDVREDVTSHHLDDREHDNTIHHLDDGKDATPHQVDVREDATPHQVDVREDATPHDFGIHKDDISHNLDVRDDDTSDQLDTHIGGSPCELDLQKDHQSPEPISPKLHHLAAVGGDTQDISAELLLPDKLEHSKSFQSKENITEININTSDVSSLQARENSSSSEDVTSQNVIQDSDNNDPIV